MHCMAWLDWGLHCGGTSSAAEHLPWRLPFGSSVRSSHSFVVRVNSKDVAKAWQRSPGSPDQALAHFQNYVATMQTASGTEHLPPLLQNGQPHPDKMLYKEIKVTQGESEMKIGIVSIVVPHFSSLVGLGVLRLR